MMPRTAYVKLRLRAVYCSQKNWPFKESFNQGSVEQNIRLEARVHPLLSIPEIALESCHPRLNRPSQPD